MNTFNFFQCFIECLLKKPTDAGDLVLVADVAGVLPPEITALQGRPQPAQYHPEGDAFVHTVLAVRRAYDLGGSFVDIWATLLHDLGKAVTPNDNLPHHFNHEALGVPLVHQLCDRLGVEGDYRVVAALAAKEHLNIHKFFELRPVKKVDLIERLGDYVPNVALVAQADAQGRGPTLVDKPYPQRQAVIDAWHIIRDIRDNNQENQRRLRAKAIAGKFGK